MNKFGDNRWYGIPGPPGARRVWYGRMDAAASPTEKYRPYIWYSHSEESSGSGKVYRAHTLVVSYKCNKVQKSTQCHIPLPRNANCLFACVDFSFISSLVPSFLLLQAFLNATNSFLNGISSCVTNCGMVHRVVHSVLLLYGRFPATVFGDTGVGTLLGEGSFPLGDVSWTGPWSVPCAVFVVASCSFKEFDENWVGEATSRSVITRACRLEL